MHHFIFTLFCFVLFCFVLIIFERFDWFLLFVFCVYVCVKGTYKYNSELKKVTITLEQTQIDNQKGVGLFDTIEPEIELIDEKKQRYIDKIKFEVSVVFLSLLHFFLLLLFFFFFLFLIILTSFRICVYTILITYSLSFQFCCFFFSNWEYCVRCGYIINSSLLSRLSFVFCLLIGCCWCSDFQCR
jgi:hypothetical protein